MANAPVQVILNSDSFRKDREIQTPKSAGTDFFKGNDLAFQEHKLHLRSQLSAITQDLAQRPEGDVGFLKVAMRSSALAKTHRPTQAVFKSHITSIVGGTRLGEMIAEVSEDALIRVDQAIEKAEATVRMRVDKRTGEVVPAPSRYRCEVGAIDYVELWGKADRRRFELDEAIEWLTDARTGQAYIVELFDRPPVASALDVLSESKRKLFETFSDGLRAFGPGLIVRLPPAPKNMGPLIEVKLTKSKAPSAIFIQSRTSTRPSGDSAFDSDRERHRALIGFLESHALVREIKLPNIIIQSAAPAMPSSASVAPAMSIPVDGSNYPVVGVIDGGISDEHAKWVVYKHGFLAQPHIKADHGTFIAGLLVVGNAMNPTLGLEADGCHLADIDIFPDSTQAGAFEQYFPDGLGGFFDELSVAVESCRKQFGIRVYNLSLNIVSATRLDRYSLEASRLDQIAEQLDVIFIISAGNLDSKNMRPEWPADNSTAAAILASHRDDQLFVPAESLRNLSVAAINPIGLSNSIEGAPARYSRRGPALRTGVKPDLCHVGGSGTLCPNIQHGLNSRTPSGASTSGCGTSYATPLVAKTIATLASKIEGEPSRETLLALTIHSSRMPKVLSQKAFNGVAQQLVGFGQPSLCDAALEGSESEITLLFSSRMFEGKTMEFRFTWPPSLVLAGGKCRGNVRLTLVSTPPVDYRFGEELMRANIEAALQQETTDGKFHSELEPTYVFFSDEEKANESSLIEHKFKWAPIKAFGTSIPKGRGKSSNWRLVVNYLNRAGESLPAVGVPFSILLTIADPKGEAPIFREIRQTLQASGIQTADIRTAIRVTPRV